MTVVTPPVAANSLLALVGASTPVGYETGGGTMCVDHVNDVAYFLEDSATAGVKKITGGTTGTETLQALNLDIFGDAGGGTPNHVIGVGASCYHPGAGKLLTAVDGAFNSDPIAVINVSTLVADFVAGQSSSSLDHSTNFDTTGPRYLFSAQMIPLQAGDTSYVVSRGLRSGSHENEVGIFQITGTTLFVVYAQDIAEPLARLCSGDNGPANSVAEFFVVGDQFSRGGGDPTSVTLYRFLVHGLTVGKATLGALAPADIDATWTNFSAVSNPGYDTSDGNIVVSFTTLDAVTTTSYLAKISATTGAVLWKTAINASAVDFAQCSLNGTLGVFNASGSRTLALVDLSSGAVTTQSWNNGFTTVISQVWDYASGSLTANMAYTQSTGPVPTYLGTYLAAHSNVVPSSRWGRLFTAQTYVGPDPTPPDAATAPQRAWTYVQDGHTFYVLDLGAEGTFVFDIITQHWSKFYTTSTTPLWNLSNGTMWNDRIVGGDRSGNEVWELDPNATLDNGTDEITRTVSCSVQRLSRNFMSVGVMRVDCSSGVLSGSGDSSLALRFSDDEEHTWVSVDPVTLTAGDYSGEVAFRALGAFAAPGRVFELSDTGGLVRINSASIDPEADEDDAKQSS